MAFNSTDWTIDYALKTVTNNDSGTGNNLPTALGDYSKVGAVIDFFQWLATTFANSSQMDDDYPIQSDTPTVYKWQGGWTFGNSNDYKYLNGGSIEDPAGSGTATADSVWANIYSIGSQETGTQIYVIQNDVEVTPWWISGNIDILLLVKNAGAWVQSPNTSGIATNGGVWCYAREFGDTYDHNFADLSGSGRNPVGINTSRDGTNVSGELYVTISGSSGVWTPGNFAQDTTTGAIGKILKIEGNDLYLNAVRGGTFTGTNTISEFTDREAQSAGDATATITSTTDVVAGWSTITNTFGTISRDLNNGGGATNYDVEVDLQSTYSPAQGFEWLKYITRYGSSGATYTINGDDGQEYRSANEGTYTDTKAAPFGTVAGTTFFGSRGVWLVNYTVADFVLINAAGDEQSPPDYQKVTVTHPDLSGAVSADGSVTVFVAERSGTALIKNQYTILGVTVNTIQATVAININKTPQSGVIRVGDTRYDYTGYSGDTFTGVTPDPTGETGAFYVPLMDLEAADIVASTSEQSDNIIYNAPFDVKAVVRRYGTKPYSVDTTFGANGLNFSPIISDDPQAT